MPKATEQGAAVMQAYEVRDAAGIEGLDRVERPIPQAGPGEVLVRIRAATLNYRDLLTVKGGYGSRQKFPLIPLSDAAGAVEAVGSGVSRFKVGDRVLNSFFQNWSGGEASEEKFASAPGGLLDGVLSQYRVFPQHGILHSPPHLSDAEAAALPCAGLTAWSAVVKFGATRPGSIVLTQGTGGVSLFALQFAKLAGARVIATSSNEEKLEKLRKLGADETINYKSDPQWGKQARALTDGRGVDLVVEIGGAGTLNESIRATRIGGTLAMIGVLAGPANDLRLPLVVMQEMRLQGVTVGSLDDFKAMLTAIAQHRMRPVVEKTFPFVAARDAFRYMAEGRHFGKVAITLD
jgi:NADPH:quinone reductase-like Zn-dependent oxidoreductase